MLVLKDVLRPRLRPIFSGGERVPTRQVPYRQQQILSKSHIYFVVNSKAWMYLRMQNIQFQLICYVSFTSLWFRKKGHFLQLVCFFVCY